MSKRIVQFELFPVRAPSLYAQKTQGNENDDDDDGDNYFANQMDGGCVCACVHV